MLGNIALGRAGELRVASELLLRGYEVFLTLVDSGTDIILGNGKRIQVKTARRYADPKRLGYFRYTFNFKSWRKKEGKYKAHPLTDVDFIIVWAIEDNDFFIIPAEEIRGKYSLSLGAHRKREWSRYRAFRDNWESLKI